MDELMARIALSLSLLLMLSDFASAEGKKDILGFATGMTVEAATANAHRTGVKCGLLKYDPVTMRHPTKECHGSAGRIQLKFTKAIKPPRIVEVTSFFPSGETESELVKNIEKQFGPLAVTTAATDKFKRTYSFFVDRKAHAVGLTLTPGTISELTLYNSDLETEDEKAKEVDYRKLHPTPKF
jgi:hypothetical protein